MWSSIFNVVNFGKGSAEKLGFKTRLQDTELMEAAIKETGLDDFGDTRFREGLSVLVEALVKEADLSPLGKLVVRADIIRLLTNRLKMIKDRRENTGMERIKIKAPLFIFGLPRSGTTFMHRLVAKDSIFRSPLTWETMLPSPNGVNSSGNHIDLRIKKAAEKLTWFSRLAPEYKKIHPVGALHPQECIAILTHCFRSVRFHRTQHVPSYWEWLHQADNVYSYTEHKKFLQHLQYFNPDKEQKHWMLKTPSHVFFIDEILKVYPDAKFIQTHRDPITALTSNASQINLLRKTFSSNAAISDADRIVKSWSKALDKALEIRKSIGEDRIMDIYYPHDYRDPAKLVRKIYHHFDHDIPDDLEKSTRDFSKNNTKGKDGKHVYNYQEMGFNYGKHWEQFEQYTKYFGIKKENQPANRLEFK